VPNINELEYVKGFIYANQWLTNYILKIDASNGKVAGRMDLTNLEKEVQAKNPDVHEMNGIAYNSNSNTFYITGKLWPTIYEIKVE
jgi:glutamine cyclotransferase